MCPISNSFCRIDEDLLKMTPLPECTQWVAPTITTAGVVCTFVLHFILHLLQINSLVRNSLMLTSTWMLANT
jgi:hypothetical protein